MARARRKGSAGTVSLLLCVVGALALALGVAGFKENDFKKCAQASFCERHRGKIGDVYAIQGGVAVEGAVLQSRVHHEEEDKYFKLQITGYDGMVRLFMTELDEGLGNSRYRVPDVLMPGLDDRQATWSPDTEDSDSISFKLNASSTTVRIDYEPLQVVIYVQGEQLIRFNGRQMLNYEHLQGAQRRPEWQEKFKGHLDTRPKGPAGISFDLTFPGVQHVYGLPERAVALSLPDTVTPAGRKTEPYRLYNLDVFEYLDDSPFGLYGSIPLLLAHRVGATVGAFWLNASEMFVDVTHIGGGTDTQWIAESGVLDLFILLGPRPADVMAQYAGLTGTTSMPQTFALGYHQCRWNYRDEADVAAVDAGFDEHNIPYDVLWLDIEHTDGKRYMTWDHRTFPSPADMQNKLAARGRNMVAIVDPHVKRDSHFKMHQVAQENKYYVRNRDGGDFEGWCWPGSSSYLDVTSAQIRSWWADQFLLAAYPGSTPHLHIWNDMNEPSVFNGPEVTMPKDNLHHGDVEHRDLHNLYGLYYHMATAEGLARRGEAVHGADGDRPFVLSRAFFSGTQRVGPIWTGDNMADWNHLKVSLPMVLTLGVTGLPFSGADVGGFFGNPNAELLTRWYQAGAYYPFFRGHAHLETKRREPWLMGEPTTTRIRNAIRERYALMPYLYTLFRAANTTGAPIMRPMWYEFPADPDTFDIDDQFLLGPGLLVRPVMEAGVGTVSVALPKASRWYDSATGEERVAKGMFGIGSRRFSAPVTMESIPTFVRGGSILPRRERPRRNVNASLKDPLTLVIALDTRHEASGEIYLDDGASYAFTRGEFLHRVFTFKDGMLKCTPAEDAGSMASDVVVERIIVLGLPMPANRYRAKLLALHGKPARALEAAPGAPKLLPRGADTAVVVRKPLLRVADAWTVKFEM